MTKNHAGCPGAQRPRGSYVFTVFNGQCLRPCQPRKSDPTYYRQCYDCIHDARPQQTGQGNGKQYTGEGNEYINNQYTNLVPPAAKPGCKHTDDCSHNE